MVPSLKNLASAIVGAIDRRINDNLRQTGEIAVAHARPYASVRTGAMRGGIRYEVSNRTLRLIDDVPWAIFQNYGTRRGVHGQFFMERGLAEAGRIVWGASLEISFPNTPTYHRPIYAHRGGYVLPNNLTRGQRRHVAEHLLPASRALHTGNVRRARLRVGHGG